MALTSTPMGGVRFTPFRAHRPLLWAAPHSFLYRCSGALSRAFLIQGPRDSALGFDPPLYGLSPWALVSMTRKVRKRAWKDGREKQGILTGSGILSFPVYSDVAVLP